ncbi:MAG TPA: NAD(P)H-dependent oxidoreductase [Pseudonocardiaceae bacterium]|jgi:chromate reductase|nr:NAD(P)H-dependent oxidoreductase [Pseudonocardiaceae bacterium]
MVVLGLFGSLRRGSYNRRLLEAAAAELPPGVTLEMFEGLAEVPPYNEDDAAPGVVRALRDAITAAGAVLIATPEYNGSVPGQLKNALDWASRPFLDNSLRNKPVAVMGASTGLFGAVWAQAELRKVLRTIGADVVEQELPVGQAHDAFTEDGSLVNPDLRSAIADLVEQLVSTARTEAEQLT